MVYEIQEPALSLLESENQYLELSAKLFSPAFSGTKIDGNHAGTVFSCMPQHIPLTKKKLEIRTPKKKFS